MSQYDQLYGSALSNPALTYLKAYAPLTGTISQDSLASDAIENVSLGTLGTYAPGGARASGTSADAFGDAMMRTTPTTFTGNAAPNTNAFVGQPGAFGWAMFPVVYSLSPQNISGSIGSTAENPGTLAQLVVPFAVIASTSPLNRNFHPQLVEDYFIESAAGRQVQINKTFLGRSIDAQLSIRASAKSLLGRWGGQGTCYLTVVPFIGEQEQDFYDKCRQYTGLTNNEISERNCFAFKGASLGMAVAAAIAGLPPMAYTGYLGSQGVNQIYNKAGPEEGSDVILGANMVENVKEIPAKVYWALSTQSFLMIPHNVVWYNQEAGQLIANATNAALEQRRRNPQGQLVDQPTMLSRLSDALKTKYANTGTLQWAFANRNLFYSCQMRSAGYNFAVNGSFILTAVNFSDATIMAATVFAHAYVRPMSTNDALQYAAITKEVATAKLQKKAARRVVQKAKPKVKKSAAEKKAAREKTKKKAADKKAKIQATKAKAISRGAKLPASVSLTKTTRRRLAAAGADAAVGSAPAMSGPQEPMAAIVMAQPQTATQNETDDEFFNRMGVQAQALSQLGGSSDPMDDDFDQRGASVPAQNRSDRPALAGRGGRGIRSQGRGFGGTSIRDLPLSLPRIIRPEGQEGGEAAGILRLPRAARKQYANESFGNNNKARLEAYESLAQTPAGVAQSIRSKAYWANQ